MNKLKTLLLSSALVSASGLAYADNTTYEMTGPEKIQALIDSLNDIQGSLNYGQVAVVGAVGYAGIGGIVPDSALNGAAITPEQFATYVGARDAVLQHDYAIASTAEQLFMQEHAAAMNNLMGAVDDLSMATNVIMMATSVAEEASVADTKPEQVALQNMLGQEQYSIDETKVDAYNQALMMVDTYAQEAGAYMAAANNAELTASIDMYAQQNGFMVGTYTAFQYTANLDEFIITWDEAGFGTGWQGYLTQDFKTVQEMYDAGEYILQYGGYPTDGS